MKDFLSDLEFLSGKPLLTTIIKSKMFNINRVCLETGFEIDPHT